MLPCDSCEEPEQRLAAQRQRAAKLSGRDVYIATGVHCVSNYGSALGRGEAFILTTPSRRRRPFWQPLSFQMKVTPGVSRLN